MQFLLNQEEMEAANANVRALEELPSVEELQKFCTFVSDNLVPPDRDRPWGCILTKKRESYCDKCPSKDVCPHPNKYWSK